MYSKPDQGNTRENLLNRSLPDGAQRTAAAAAVARRGGGGGGGTPGYRPPATDVTKTQTGDARTPGHGSRPPPPGAAGAGGSPFSRAATPGTRTSDVGSCCRGSGAPGTSAGRTAELSDGSEEAAVGASVAVSCRSRGRLFTERCDRAAPKAAAMLD